MDANAKTGEKKKNVLLLFPFGSWQWGLGVIHNCNWSWTKHILIKSVIHLKFINLYYEQVDKSCVGFTFNCA